MGKENLANLRQDLAYRQFTNLKRERDRNRRLGIEFPEDKAARLAELNERLGVKYPDKWDPNFLTKPRSKTIFKKS